jgi:hypothetical protein
MVPRLRFAGAALFPVFLATAAQAQPAAVPTEKTWALAASAILAERNGDQHDLLEGRPRTSENIAYAIGLLRRSWSVADHDQLLVALRSLRATGYRQYFTRFGKRAQQGGNEMPKDFEQRRRIEIAAAYYPKFGSKSIRAWDYMRYISLCRWGYLAGYFSEQEAWDYIMPAARLLQRTFGSWQEMGRNFLVGREFWSPADEWKAQTEYAYYRLLTERQSPWRRHLWNQDLGEGAPPPGRQVSVASLDIVARPRGLTCLLLDVIDRPDAETLVPAMEQALGCKLRIQSDKSDGTDRILRAECIQKPARAQREVMMSYRLEPLAAALRKLDVSQLFVFTGHYLAGESEIVPAADYHWIRDRYLYYEKAYDLSDSLPASTLRYGFTPAQVARVSNLGAAFLALVWLSALALRRTLESSMPGAGSWTRFARAEAVLTAAVWFGWPVILVFGDGLPILRLAIGGEEYAGTILAAALALIPALLLQAASAALLAPVYWRLRGVEVTRGQIVRAAVLQSAVWAPAAGHALVLADPHHRVDMGMLVVLFAIVQLLEFLLHRKWLSATGAKGTLVAGGALKTRILELAFELKAGVKRVYLIPDGPWKWRQVYSVGDGSMAIPAAAIETLSRREMDAAVVGLITWVRAGNDRKLIAMKSLGAFAIFVAGYAFNGSLGPLGTVLFVRYSWIVLDVQLALKAARMERKGDLLTLKALHAPDALLRSIIKLERLRLHAPDAQLKKRLASIAKQAGLDDANLATLLAEPEGPFDRYPVPEPAPGELAVVA